MSLKKDDAELDNFLACVDEVAGLVQQLSSENRSEAEKAVKKADLYLRGKTDIDDLEEEKCVVTTNRTIINKNAFASMDKSEEGTMSPGNFMSSVARDAEERARRRKDQQEIADELKRRGNEAFRKADFMKALGLYNRAIEELRDSCILYTNRALTCNRLGLWSRAISDCDWALRINPKSLKALLYKAEAYAGQGNVAESEECLRLALEYHPNLEDEIQQYGKTFAGK